MQSDIIRVLFIGDVVGRPGRKVLKKNVVKLKEDLKIDFLLANIENLSGGFGVTEKAFNEINNIGVIDGFTSGNHIWDKKEAEKFIENHTNIIRPLNYPEMVPGRKYFVLKKDNKKLAVVNLLGRALMKDTVDCPFQTIDRVLNRLKKETNNIFVDFHAEATSEKEAMGFFLNGKVSAVVGTHTHVQTADDKIMSEGTAYISDAGMTGNVDSVIGFHEKNVIEKFITQMPRRFEIKNKGAKEIQGVIVSIDSVTGKSLTIDRIKYKDS